jgi:hypothetical protein
MEKPKKDWRKYEYVYIVRMKETKEIVSVWGSRWSGASAKQRIQRMSDTPPEVEVIRQPVNR